MNSSKSFIAFRATALCQSNSLSDSMSLSSNGIKERAQTIISLAEKSTGKRHPLKGFMIMLEPHWVMLTPEDDAESLIHEITTAAREEDWDIYDNDLQPDNHAVCVMLEQNTINPFIHLTVGPLDLTLDKKESCVYVNLVCTLPTPLHERLIEAVLDIVIHAFSYPLAETNIPDCDKYQATPIKSLSSQDAALAHPLFEGTTTEERARFLSQTPSVTLTSLSLNDYLGCCLDLYRSAGYQCDNLTPRQAYEKYADGRHGDMLDLPPDDHDAFKEWVEGRSWSGNHPFEIIYGPGSVSNGLHLIPKWQHEQVTLWLSTDENGFTGSVLVRAFADNKSLWPLVISDNFSEIIKGDALVGIYPAWHRAPFKFHETKKWFDYYGYTIEGELFSDDLAQNSPD